MRAAIAALLLCASSVLAQTTMTPPASGGGWQGWRAGVKVGGPLITQDRCWLAMRADAAAQKAAKPVPYTCTFTWRSTLSYKPVVAPPVVEPPVVVPPALGSLKLSWQAVTRLDTGKSLLPGDIVGYRVHYGTAPGAYTVSVDVGDTISHQVRDLPPATYYVAVTAIAAWGEESAMSVEASKVIP